MLEKTCTSWAALAQDCHSRQLVKGTSLRSYTDAEQNCKERHRIGTAIRTGLFKMGRDLGNHYPSVSGPSIASRTHNLCTILQFLPEQRKSAQGFYVQMRTFQICARLQGFALALRAVAGVFVHSFCSSRSYQDLTARMPPKTARGTKKRTSQEKRLRFPKACRLTREAEISGTLQGPGQNEIYIYIYIYIYLFIYAAPPLEILRFLGRTEVFGQTGGDKCLETLK